MGKFRAPVTDQLILPAVVGLPVEEIHSRRRSGRPVPEAVPIRFLIDTGAKRTTLTPELIDRFAPQISRTVRIFTPLAVGTATIYWVRLDFPDAGLAAFEKLEVACLAMPAGLNMFHGLLGRDLLRSMESLVYEGQKSRFTLRDQPGLFSWLRPWL